MQATPLIRSPRRARGEQQKQPLVAASKALGERAAGSSAIFWSLVSGRMFAHCKLFSMLDFRSEARLGRSARCTQPKHAFPPRRASRACSTMQSRDGTSAAHLQRPSDLHLRGLICEHHALGVLRIGTSVCFASTTADISTRSRRSHDPPDRCFPRIPARHILESCSILCFEHRNRNARDRTSASRRRR